MRSWLNSNWLELLITILVAVIEIAMITPWLVLFLVTTGRSGIDPVVPIGAGVIGLLSFWSARELLARQWDPAAMRMVSLGIWLAALVVWYALNAGARLTAPFEFIDRLFQFDSMAVGLLLLGGLAWWRGNWLASTEDLYFPEFIRSEVLRVVASHVAVLVVAGIFWENVSAPVRSIASVTVPVGFAACLIAATAIQVRTARLNIRTPEGQRPAGRGWLGAGAGIAAGILLVAAIVAGTAGREAWQILLWPFIQVLRGVGFVLDLVLLAFGFVAFILFLPIFWVLQRLIASGEEPDFVEETGGVLEPAEEPPGAVDLPEPVLQILEWGVVAAIIVVVVWLAMRQLQSRRRARDQSEEEEIRESVWSKDALRRDLGEMLRFWRPGWFDRRHSIDLRRPPETVRDAYRYTLVHAGRQGIARDRRESALQYSGRLRSAQPEVSDPLDDLTERYLRARYAEQTSDEDVSVAREDWDAIRQRLRHSQQSEN